MRRAGAALALAGLAALGWAAACTTQQAGVEPPVDTTDSGLASYGETGFQCASPTVACCALSGCFPTWQAASSCAVAAAMPAGYVLSTAPCEGLYAVRRSDLAGAYTTYEVFDVSRGALVAFLEYETALPGGGYPEGGAPGFTCSMGPAALPVANECLVHWSEMTASDPCLDAGVSPDAGCPPPSATDAAVDAPAD